MALRIIFLTMALRIIFLFAFIYYVHSNTTINIDDFKSEDDTQAFTRAWEKCCSTEGRVVLTIPSEKKYHIKPIKFQGPCKFSHLTFDIRGTVAASNNILDYGQYGSRWLVFENIKDLLVQGGGTVDGYGDVWWNRSCNPSMSCKQAPTALTFHNCEKLQVRNLVVRNAQQDHIAFNHCKKVKISHLIIYSAEKSLNTNGIYISHTEEIDIANTDIRTGDDCISVMSGTKKLRVNDITCGSGYGISIGDLGSGNSEAHVTDVIIDKAKFVQTRYGLRIKTIQGGSGSVSGIKFKNIQMNNVHSPIVIEQNSCNNNLCKQQKGSVVQVRDVLFENIKGTSATKTAIKLDCSEEFGCKGIVLENVHLEYHKNPDHTEALCQNVEFFRFGNVIPSCDSNHIDHQNPKNNGNNKPQPSPQPPQPVPQQPQPSPQPPQPVPQQPQPNPPSIQKPGIISIDDFGAKGQGQDDTMAFKKAWEKACSSNIPIVLVVPPRKNYIVKPIIFEGPCKSSVTVQIGGTIEASTDRSDYVEHNRNWIMFQTVNDLVVEGGGTFNGNGNTWWKQSCVVNKALPCTRAPTGLTFFNCKNLVVRNLSIKDSQQMQVMFVNCNTVEASHLTVTAPAHSPNTDGIHVTHTQNIDISDCVIGTGDDCISIVSGSKNVTATDITCGPGHGISVGSLGSGNSEAHVSDVFVRRAKFYETTNGVRIKTWQGGFGDATNIKFQDIEMHNVRNPIIIDQNYCGRSKTCKQQESAVQVRNVVYQNIKGTSASEVAIKLDCSERVGCEGIVLQDVELVHNHNHRLRGQTKAFCHNTHFTLIGHVAPFCPHH